MYRFITEKKEDLLNGHKIMYVAEQVGMSKSYLSNILNGRINCSKKLALAICQFKDVELEEFFVKEE